MLDMLAFAHIIDHMRRLSAERRDEEEFYRSHAGYPWSGLVRRLKARSRPKAPVAEGSADMPRKPPCSAGHCAPQDRRSLSRPFTEAAGCR